MVKNSLLEAYGKYEYLLNELYASDYQMKLRKRAKDYDNKGMTGEFWETRRALEIYEHYKHLLSIAFSRGPLPVRRSKFNRNDDNEYSWRYFYKNADQLLYGLPHLNNLHGVGWGTSNDCLFAEVVKEINKEYPDEKWELGEIPLFRWKLLNPPGYELDEEDLASWESNPNVYKDCYGRYIERFAQNIKCIYCSAAKSILEESKTNLGKFSENCDVIAKYKQAFVVDDKIFVDHECSGGYDVGIDVKFIEGIESTPYRRTMKPIEIIINNTIVSEIDKKCANLEGIQQVHTNLDYIQGELNEFLIRYDLKSGHSHDNSKSEEGM